MDMSQAPEGNLIPRGALQPAGNATPALQDAHHLLQALHTEAAKGAALQAGIVWQFYGEQSTFWFHHLARERQGRTELQALRTGSAPDSPRAVLDHPAGRDQGGDLLRAYSCGESADGLFAAQPVSHAAQDELLQALDRRLSQEAAAAGEGDLGDGSVSLAELEAAAKSLPRGKAPGLDGIPYEFYLLFFFFFLRGSPRYYIGANRTLPSTHAIGYVGKPVSYLRFWPELGQEFTDMLQEAFSSGASPALPPSLLQGRIQGERSGQGVSGQLQAHHAAEHRLQAGSAGDRQPHRPAAQPGCGRHPDRLPSQALDWEQCASPP